MEPLRPLDEVIAEVVGDDDFGKRVRDIAREIGVDPGLVGRLLNQMEDFELVSRSMRRYRRKKKRRERR
ncbi:MAG: hypothetical protein JRD89_20085 [Deltaproteobacteria bacterium]|nr:hypothetical protein [Deltaproteobacteria bacterium]